MENKNDLEYAELEDTDTSKVEDAPTPQRWKTLIYQAEWRVGCPIFLLKIV